uniref:Uncharacterized protein n=1 Tax=Seriola dumerili TaxID=41447 RepID=A0A3B4UTN1_SERDU
FKRSHILRGICLKDLVRRGIFQQHNDSKLTAKTTQESILKQRGEPTKPLQQGCEECQKISPHICARPESSTPRRSKSVIKSKETSGTNLSTHYSLCQP